MCGAQVLGGGGMEAQCKEGRKKVGYAMKVEEEAREVGAVLAGNRMGWYLGVGEGR